MSLAKWAILAGTGYAIYRLTRQAEPAQRAAFADGEANPQGLSQVRNAGPAAMSGDCPQWDCVDEASDESFPASDSPASY